MAPPVQCSAFGYMNILYMDTHEVHLGRIPHASHTTLIMDIRLWQARIFTVKQDRSCRDHHYGET
jgi:hypothetical protein